MLMAADAGAEAAAMPGGMIIVHRASPINVNLNGHIILQVSEIPWCHNLVKPHLVRGQSISPQCARRSNTTWEYSITVYFRHRTSVNRYTNLQLSQNLSTAAQSGTLTTRLKLTPWKVCTNLPAKLSAKLSQGSGKPTPHLCASPSTGPPYPNAGRSKSSRYAIAYSSPSYKTLFAPFVSTYAHKFSFFY